MAKNIEISVQKNVMTLKIDLSKSQGKSGSGKSDIIATTSGNMDVPGAEGVKLGVNCYKKA